MGFRVEGKIGLKLAHQRPHSQQAKIRFFLLVQTLVVGNKAIPPCSYESLLRPASQTVLIVVRPPSVNQPGLKIHEDSNWVQCACLGVGNSDWCLRSYQIRDKWAR